MQSAQTDNAMGVIESEALKKLLVNDYIDTDDDQAYGENLASRQKDIFSSFQLFYVTNPLLHMVDALSFALTDINVEKRAKGTGLLAECVHQCVPGSMDELETETLMKFFCDRIKDHHSIQPIVIYAFLGLISYQKVNNEQVITMLRSIFAEIHVQSLVQADRRNIFNIFSNLLKTKTDVLKQCSEFIFGFIQAMDSERDPRNLVICFENAYVIIKELDFSLFTEDLFEVLSCYFPVEFQEPKEDKFRIKKEDLVDALRSCLTAEKSFAQYAIPLYLEKLSSDVMEAKLDSLVTFTECLKIYDPEDVAQYVDDIWLGVRKDYLLSDYKELATPYLDFVYNLIKCLSAMKSNEPLIKIIDFLTKDCLQTLKDPEMIIAIPCGNIILCASNASHHVFEEIINKLILPIQEGLEKYTSIPQRSNMLEIVTKILSVDNIDIVPNRLLIEFVDYLIPLLYILLADNESVTLQVLSLRCLKNIIAKSSWFKHCNFDILAQHCFCPMQEKFLSAQLLLEYKSFIEIISERFPLIFKKQYLEILEKKVVGRLDRKIVSQCFKLLEYTSFKNEELVHVLYSYFDTFIILATNDNLRDAGDVLSSYINILKKSNTTVDGMLFVLPLINIMKSVDLSVDLLLKISHLFSGSFNLLNIVQRKEVYMFVYNILSNQYRISENFFGSEIILHLENKLLQFSILLRGVFTQLKSHDLHEIDVDNVCKEIMKTMGKVDCFETLQNFGIVFGSIVNKLPTDSPLTKKYLDIVCHIIGTDKQCSSAIVLFSWITKGLVLNWQSSTTIAIDVMLSSLNNEAVANVAASGFSIIVKDVDGAFTKESCASIKLMYKQRYTQYVLPLLIQHYYDGGDEVKSFHMIAISNTLHAIPKHLLQKHLKSMMPLLMHSLVTCNSTPITESSLSTIAAVLGDNKDVIMDYVPSLVPSLLNHITHDNMNIRILSLKSLAILSSYTSHVVQPMKQEVVRKIRPVLDDRKRLVRKEAIHCSNSWHLMLPGKE